MIRLAHSFITHAPSKGAHSLCGSLIRPGHPVTTDDSPPMCNACQRALWEASRPKQGKRKKLCRAVFTVPAFNARTTRESRCMGHKLEMLRRREEQLARTPNVRN